jgi:hypothetical protein
MYQHWKKDDWSPLLVWHCWNWRQPRASRKSQGAILRSQEKPSGVAERELKLAQMLIGGSNDGWNLEFTKTVYEECDQTSKR